MRLHRNGARRAPRHRIKKTDWGYLFDRGFDACFVVLCVLFSIAVAALIVYLACAMYDSYNRPEYPFSGFAPDCPTDFSHYEHIRKQYPNAF